jgi:hypothetical protein
MDSCKQKAPLKAGLLIYTSSRNLRRFFFLAAVLFSLAIDRGRNF